MYNDTAKGLLCGVGGGTGTIQATFAAAGSGGLITSCNPDYNIAQLGFVTRWTPVKNLTFSADVTWTHLDQKYAGTAAVNGNNVGKPNLLYTLADQDTVLLLLRAQRNW
jgi:hypothetical protein